MDRDHPLIAERSMLLRIQMMLKAVDRATLQHRR